MAKKKNNLNESLDRWVIGGSIMGISLIAIIPGLSVNYPKFSGEIFILGGVLIAGLISIATTQIQIASKKDQEDLHFIRSEKRRKRTEITISRRRRIEQIETEIQLLDHDFSIADFEWAAFARIISEKIYDRDFFKETIEFYDGQKLEVAGRYRSEMGMIKSLNSNAILVDFENFKNAWDDYTGYVDN